MSFQAGFAEVDITPPLGTHKIGWLVDIVPDRIADPLYARVAVFRNGDQAVAMVSLDLLSVRWTTVNEIRRRAQQQFGLSGEGILVAATHNHAGPAVANLGEVRRDDAYTETMVTKVVAALGQAASAAREARVGRNWAFDFDVAHNRRVIQRDGTTRTHGDAFNAPQSLCFEGPIDPEVAVIAARSPEGEALGAIVSYACHPTHHGGDKDFSGGYPGALARAMKDRGWPVTVFLNGPCGNVHFADPARGGKGMEMDEIGQRLTERVSAATGAIKDWDAPSLAARRKTIQLPYRKVSQAEIDGTIRGAQRFGPASLYPKALPPLLERMRTRRTQPAEVQVIDVGDWSLATAPAEYFVQFGLRIKERAYPRHALPVSCANGMVGYVPTPEAFARGGYETTFLPSSRMAPECGDLLADTAIELIRQAK